jgi:hypothetical protein
MAGNGAGDGGAMFQVRAAAIMATTLKLINSVGIIIQILRE